MDLKSLYADNLRKSLEKKELIEVISAIELFAKHVLRYDKRLSDDEVFSIFRVEEEHLELDGRVVPLKSTQSESVAGATCCHFFRATGKEYGNSGLVVKAHYHGPRPSRLRLICRLFGIGKTDLHVDDLECFGYGEEWEGEEVQTPECFSAYLGVKVPRLKQISIESVVGKYQASLRNGIRIPVE